MRSDAQNPQRRQRDILRVMTQSLLSGGMTRAWSRMLSLFVPSVSMDAVLLTKATSDDPQATALHLYEWERDRLLTLAKGLGAAAVTVLAALIADATQGKVQGPTPVAYLAGGLVAVLLLWAGFILTGLRRLAEQYSVALVLVS